jgi:hypothetical protein
MKALVARKKKCEIEATNIQFQFKLLLTFVCNPHYDYEFHCKVL